MTVDHPDRTQAGESGPRVITGTRLLSALFLFVPASASFIDPASITGPIG